MRFPKSLRRAEAFALLGLGSAGCAVFGGETERASDELTTQPADTLAAPAQKPAPAPAKSPAKVEDSAPRPAPPEPERVIPAEPIPEPQYTEPAPPAPETSRGVSDKERRTLETELEQDLGLAEQLIREATMRAGGHPSETMRARIDSARNLMDAARAMQESGDLRKAASLAKKARLLTQEL